MLEPLYWAISWIMLQWHALWHLILGGGEFLKTNWDWVLAIVFLVLTIRTLLFPVFVKQIKSQRAMQAIAPQIKELQAKHKGDRETLQREMMDLYKREKANPLMGCLPMVVQIPVMWALFHVLRHLNPNRAAVTKQISGWTINQFDSAANARLFGAPIAASFKSTAADLADMHANGTTVKIVAGALVAIMIITTYLTSRQMILKTGWAEDPQQRMIQRLMLYGIPISLLISGTVFPIGVVIYWVTTNLFSLGQQFWVLRKYPPPVPAGKAATGTARAGTASAPAMSSLTDMILGRKSKPAAKGTAANANGAPKVDGKALAPKPGAKPVNPKRGTPAKSPAAQGAAGSRADDGSRATSQGGAAKAKGTAGQGASAAKRGTAPRAKRPSG
ncbi:MAG: membrane protein insertase YidC [Actinobacteria bacterium]|nr:MAG: membrane protein insertase YidC [Actinomycetota bacterium]